ncbi:efflux RND transporter periplasmic adaptor subunit [uncultured Gimesia sp.]|jgi:membrane fusion protein, multidrug efflux system|uniref:efflux RND transporter periplasmic adaptor subunit n=1 Tax=uncultured Gimesia sp. TaxID=1678688 RepID=UPI0026394A73|nr:efflux RND transporter periplasmic adaptor subunit [uncultured Gimesia sp.]
MKVWFSHKGISIFIRILLYTAGLVVLLLSIAWLSGMFEKKVASDWQERGVRRHSAEPMTVVHEVTKPYVEEAIGTLKASSRTIVASKVLASIAQIHVKAGDQVSKGQPLIDLDAKEYQSRLSQAKQSEVSTAATHAEAEKDFKRVETLLKKNVVTKSDFDRATRELQVAEAEESRAKQAVTEAEILLSYTKIKAAKNGRIVDRLAEPGDIANPGAPLLVLYDATSLRLEAPVEEQLAVKLRLGDQLKVYVDALEREFEATIDEIVPQADAPSRSFLVKASLPRSEDLYEGMFGRLRIPAGSRKHLCLEMDAIERIGQLEFVDVVRPDGTLERRFIKTGQVGIPGRQEVLSGLQAGDQVLLKPTSPERESNADDK